MLWFRRWWCIVSAQDMAQVCEASRLGSKTGVYESIQSGRRVATWLEKKNRLNTTQLDLSRCREGISKKHKSDANERNRVGVSAYKNLK